VKFIIENAGKEKHEAVVELAGADDKPLEANGKEGRARGRLAMTGTLALEASEEHAE
jgi:hypothetical protein